MKKPFAFSFSHLNAFETCPKKYYYTYIDKKYSDKNASNEWGNKVHEHIENYMRDDVRLPMELTYLAPILEPYKKMKGEKLFEQQLALTRDFQPSDWFSKFTYCRSIIDFLAVGDTTAVVVDWKTGNRINKDFIQLEMAGAILMAFRPEIHKVILRYEYFAHRKGFTDSVTRDDIPIIWNKILPRANAVEHARKNDEFPAKPNGLCKKWCQVKSCPHNGE
jgi:CRISPR/Cas system-associated exonuclease Cas4 (RecB family)